MRVQVLSDVHVEFHVHPPSMPDARWHGRVPDVGADVLVLAGDIGIAEQGVRWAAQEAGRLGVPCLYVPGNHEYFGQVHPDALARMRAATRRTPVHLLDNDAVTIGNVRFLGATLWTDLRAYGEANALYGPDVPLERSMADYWLILMPGEEHVRRLRASDTLAWHEVSIAWLERELRQPHDGPTVVITHHGPARVCQHPRFEPDWIANGFYSPLEHLMDPDRVQLWIFGHTHASLDTMVNRVRLVSNQRGYPGEEVPGGFDPAKVWEV